MHSPKENGARQPWGTMLPSSVSAGVEEHRAMSSSPRDTGGMTTTSRHSGRQRKSERQIVVVELLTADRFLLLPAAATRSVSVALTLAASAAGLSVSVA